MTDPLNEKARPFGRRMLQAASVLGVIAVGIVVGARIWHPVRTVEQRVTAPIREVVKRVSPLEDLPEAVTNVCPAVVSLHPKGASGLPAQGVLLTGDGFVVTTAPIDAAEPFEVWLNDGRKLPGRVFHGDPLSGVSLLKIDGDDFASAALGEPDLPRPGLWGFTLNSPAGHGCMVETAIVASDFITEGNSAAHYVRIHGGGMAPLAGTPFFTPDGRLIALAREDDRFVTADLLSTVVSYLMRDSDPAPNPFGIIVEDLSPVLADRLGAARGRGAVIVLVAEGSVAKAAGLRVGDVILSAGQAPISSASELNRALGGQGTTALVVSRPGETETRTFTLVPKGRR